MTQTTKGRSSGNLAIPTTYMVEGREFIVEPVYNEQAQESMGEILLKVIMAGSGEN